MSRAAMVLACGLVTLWLVAACSTLPERPQAPRVSLVGLSLQSVELFEQRYQVRLRIKNPNAGALALRGIDFRLAINDRAFADGVSQQSVDIPAFGERVVSLAVTSNLMQVWRQLQALEDGQASGLRYRIDGSVAVGESYIRLPFDYSGEIGVSPPVESELDGGV